MIRRFGKVLVRFVGDVKTKVSKKSKAGKKQSHDSSDPKKVLMFGWELPPFNSGGLGVACFELAQSMSDKNTEVTFVLPKRNKFNISFMKVAFAEPTSTKMSVKTVDSIISPYMTEESYAIANKKAGGRVSYKEDLIDEVNRYGSAAGKLAKKEKFDVIHAHDWLSYPAGIKAKKVSKKPLVTHVHAIEYDRSHEGGVNHRICEIEKAGLEAADKVIAVSAYTKERIIKFYGIAREKIEVVHNGISNVTKTQKKLNLSHIKRGGKKMVLFVGRITYQKGVDYLIEAAQKALKINPKLIFTIVGTGDMDHQIIEQAARHGISDKVFFPGFLRGKQLETLYQSADVYVMPSVSEPFGIVALEALANGVPVIISKQSGASEVIKHSLKVDFWDTDELANNIVAVANYSTLRQSLSRHGHKEALGCTWDLAADKCMAVYDKLTTA